jgi:hypothetical protein
VAECGHAIGGAHIVRFGAVVESASEGLWAVSPSDVVWSVLPARLSSWPESVVGVKTRSDPTGHCASSSVWRIVRSGSRK